MYGVRSEALASGLGRREAVGPVTPAAQSAAVVITLDRAEVAEYEAMYFGDGASGDGDGDGDSFFSCDGVSSCPYVPE